MMNKGLVLVVEDDAVLREALCDTLTLSGYAFKEAACADDAMRTLSDANIDMVITDINMPGKDGHELLAIIGEQYPLLPVVMMTAYGCIDKAIDAIRHGAVDYLVKPFEPKRLIEIVDRVLDRGDLQEGMPVAEDPYTKQLFKLAERVANSDSSVLIMGESGTGKEVLARYIHRHSPRAKKPFVAINCAAIPENMLEAMLFGHEKGAFTGAHQSSAGKFELANGGTLLLDEITEMDLGLQAKLLRVLQEQEVERIGGKSTIELDVRVLATTNREVLEAVRSGKFREDLYYRLNVFPLVWKPLRERRKDIVPLARHLLQKYGQKSARALQLSDEAASMMEQHEWPGNVRELDNVVQRAIILQQGSVITSSDLMLQPAETLFADPADTVAPSTVSLVTEDLDGPHLGSEVRQKEYEVIIETLRSERGSKKNTAEKLGISPRTLRYKLAKMREIGIDVEAATLA